MPPLRTVVLAAAVVAAPAATRMSIVVCTGTAPVGNPALAQASRPRRNHGHVGT
jgi:hypothetical protein